MNAIKFETTYEVPRKFNTQIHIILNDSAYVCEYGNLNKEYTHPVFWFNNSGLSSNGDVHPLDYLGLKLLLFKIKDNLIRTSVLRPLRSDESVALSFSKHSTVVRLFRKNNTSLVFIIKDGEPLLDTYIMAEHGDILGMNPMLKVDFLQFVTHKYGVITHYAYLDDSCVN